MSSVPSTHAWQHTVTCNSRSRDLSPSSGLGGHLHSHAHTQTHRHTTFPLSCLLLELRKPGGALPTPRVGLSLVFLKSNALGRETAVRNTQRIQHASTSYRPPVNDHDKRLGAVEATLLQRFRVLRSETTAQAIVLIFEEQESGLWLL